MEDSVHGLEVGAIGVVRMPVGARRLDIRAPRSEALAPVVLLLSPVSGRCHSELGAEPLVGPQATPQADASLYNRHGSDTDLREGGL